MGFPKRNADGTPFRDDDEYIKALELEIEFLRNQLSACIKWWNPRQGNIEFLRNQLSACIKEHDLAIARGDEWKRRAWIIYQRTSRSQDVEEWFLEEKNDE